MGKFGGGDFDEGVAGVERNEPQAKWAIRVECGVSSFASDTEYFGPPDRAFMIGFRVRDLDAMLAQLRADQCDVDPRKEENDYGKFGWVTDPDGNRVELWEPPDEMVEG